MVRRFCDLCGKDAALDLDRMAMSLDSGRRILVSLRVEADEGEKDTRKLDICRACLRLAAQAFIKTYS